MSYMHTSMFALTVSFHVLVCLAPFLQGYEENKIKRNERNEKHPMCYLARRLCPLFNFSGSSNKYQAAKD